MATNSKKKTASEMERDRMMRDRRRRGVKINVAAYKAPTATAAAKVAHFLMWAAENYPREFLTYEEITQGVNGLSRRPAPNDKSVKLVANRISGARQNLRNKHNKDIQTKRGVGCRATVDEYDKADAIKRDAKAVKRSHEKLAKTLEMVSSKILAGEVREAKKLKYPQEVIDEMEALGEMHAELDKRIKQLNAPVIRAALTPPPTQSDLDL